MAKRPGPLAVMLAATGLLAAPLAQAGLLLAIFDEAERKAPQWQVAEQARQAVLAAEPIARAGLRPELLLDGNYGRSRVDVRESRSLFVEEERNYGDVGGAAVRLRQPLIDLPARARVAQYDARRAGAESDHQQAYQELILDVGQRYLLWLEAESALAFADAQLKTLEQRLEQMTGREELGLATLSDRLLIEAERDLADSRRIEAAAGLRAARERIRELIGRVPEQPTPLATPMPLTDPVPADPDAWVRRALDSNPTRARAVARRDEAQQAVREQRGRRYPQLALNLEHALQDSADFQLGSESENSRAELQLRLPLYQGGAVSAAIAVAEAERAQRESELWELDRALDRETRNAYDGVVTGVVRVRAARRSLQSAQAAREAINGRFDTGLATLAELLSATDKVREALRDLAIARHRYLLSTLNLESIAGSLDRDDLARVDALLAPR